MKSKGFTLIELIIILVIIGILAVSVSPVFFDSSGTQSLVLRQRAISILRSIQQQAMQNIDKSLQLEVRLEVTQNTLGVPPYNNENNLQISNIEGVNFSFSYSGSDVLPATIAFDALGRPIVFNGSGKEVSGCASACTITIKERSGVERVIGINKEGFIDAR
ncbi:prepilin-type N-terminal cleavage/methylation domain-containing protein [Idiomarina sp. M1R2S28]|uniref:Prepilin-type N-terminal cleavage/methylation domain-containing protein n=1 Tax=Idiomarina rhizosphaerae TaxID=2961572 RepID=A0A9X2G2H0_9GAMM|nr:prepilin-type N-terminal cleavage/methylation domain-containing protein [Idiomarina rhizosphaerae]MCP1338718.1 prepilin-type N-terminal cleavage/methylation domain-containing protein [Idiomarina rhizosphaerae]